MYCEKCGSKLEKNSKFCSNCGSEKVDRSIKDNSKTMSIIGFIFSFIVPIVGLILSILSINKSKKYEKESGNRSSNYGLSIAGIIISIIMFIVYFAIFVIVLVFILINRSSSELVGTWDCTTNLYSSYSVEVTFNNDKTITWGKYGDTTGNNLLSGTYSVNSTKVNNDTTEYGIKLSFDKQLVNGIDYGSATADATVKLDDDDAIIYINNSTYYCTRKQTNEF